MTLVEGDIWENITIGCIRYRLAASTVCIAEAGSAASGAVLLNPTGAQAILDFNLSTPILNSTQVVEGNKYALTDVGVQAAIDAAGSGGSVKLSPGTYTFAAMVTASLDDFVFDMTGAIINCDFAGVCIRFGETGTRRRRITAIGGNIRKTSSGTPTPDYTAGNIGVQWLNVSRSYWKGGYRVEGFRQCVYLRATDGQGTTYHHSYPQAMIDCLFPIFIQPDAGTGFVNQNIFYGGNLQHTDAMDNTGGFPIWIDTQGNAFGAASNKFFGTDMENSSTGANRPEAAIWVNGVQNQFYGPYTEGYTKNAWVVDNSGADSQRNLFVGGTGGQPIRTFNSDFRDTTTNNFQNVIGERQTWLAGGDGTNPLFVLKEVNSDNNICIRGEGAAGTLRYEMNCLGVMQLRRVRASRGTVLVAGDFALSAGWGTTASVGSITGVDQWAQFTITSSGTGQGANPTATLTFKDGTWTNAPIAVCQRADRANQTTIEFTWTTTATTLVLTFEGTPIAAETFVVACHVGGI